LVRELVSEPSRERPGGIGGRLAAALDQISQCLPYFR